MWDVYNDFKYLVLKTKGQVNGPLSFVFFPNNFISINKLYNGIKAWNRGIYLADRMDFINYHNEIFIITRILGVDIWII